MELKLYQADNRLENILTYPSIAKKLEELELWSWAKAEVHRDQPSKGFIKL